MLAHRRFKITAYNNLTDTNKIKLPAYNNLCKGKLTEMKNTLLVQRANVSAHIIHIPSLQKHYCTTAACHGNIANLPLKWNIVKCT